MGGRSTSPPSDAQDLVPPGLTDAPRAWRDGYVWMRLGRYDRAWSSWDRTDHPRALVSRAAALRELGQHGRAEDLDLGVLAQEADGEPTLVTIAARISLVADAVGRGDLEAAISRLAGAADAVGALGEGPEPDRQRTRLDWVRVEVELLAGAEPDPSGLPRLVDGEVRAPDHYRGGTDHHLAKGLMFAGVVRRDPVHLDAALELAAPGLHWALHLARADLGVPSALEDARRAWEDVRLPEELAEEVAATPTGRRLSGAPASG